MLWIFHMVALFKELAPLFPINACKLLHGASISMLVCIFREKGCTSVDCSFPQVLCSQKLISLSHWRDRIAFIRQKNCIMSALQMTMWFDFTPGGTCASNVSQGRRVSTKATKYTSNIIHKYYSEYIKL